MELGERIIEADAAGANADHEPRTATHCNRSKKQTTDSTTNPNDKETHQNANEARITFRQEIVRATARN